MNYAKIKNMDVANGPGLRVSLFVSGCTHHCPGCFNKETWDFQYGEPFTENTTEEIIALLKPKHIAGLTLLGGEPMDPRNQKAVLSLLRRVRECLPQKNIWCYTGYDFQADILGRMITQCPETKEILSYLDILVDGRFEEEKKNLNLRFRGSENQRIIKVKDSLESGQLVLWD